MKRVETCIKRHVTVSFFSLCDFAHIATYINEWKRTHKRKKKKNRSQITLPSVQMAPLSQVERLYKCRGVQIKSINQWHHNGPPLCGRFRALPECGTTSAQSVPTAAGMDIPTRGCQLSEGGLTFNKSSFEVRLQMNVPPTRQHPKPPSFPPVQAFSRAAGRPKQQRQQSEI